VYLWAGQWGGYSMEYIFYSAVIVIAFAVCVVSIIWAIKNYKKQMTVVNGLNYRKEHGVFDIDRYVQGTIKTTVSRRQRNNGPNPKEYDKKISFVDHFNKSVYTTPEKRMTK